MSKCLATKGKAIYKKKLGILYIPDSIDALKLNLAWVASSLELWEELKVSELVLML